MTRQAWSQLKNCIDSSKRPVAVSGNLLPMLTPSCQASPELFPGCQISHAIRITRSVDPCSIRIHCHQTDMLIIVLILSLFWARSVVSGPQIPKTRSTCLAFQSCIVWCATRDKSLQVIAARKAP
ncbi:uncharacterized protein L969DRAFT_88525 [Mixia osmundae IAM 14324]|uniref:uncharacterized protein n=1 Tax=Mixia osmundae (strain CBS 9802 / IAM 14324 / JCM 22182 / KY 12970) TaxID=764103 RepID=UPI0004A55A4B|nr:uncharacterized protein L969DRAFT_88525 [Mixia osmundae IAM 14324]KEI39087.1 hypothetical protein L969DRAFT_88525 [Mixia osmundae IAM 14324]